MTLKCYLYEQKLKKINETLKSKDRKKTVIMLKFMLFLTCLEALTLLESFYLVEKIRQYPVFLLNYSKLVKRSWLK